MNTGAWIVVIAGGLAALAVVAWFLTSRKHPETSPPGRYVADRPAGPGAESQRVDERGTLRSGPVPRDAADEVDGPRPVDRID